MRISQWRAQNVGSGERAHFRIPKWKMFTIKEKMSKIPNSPEYNFKNGGGGGGLAHAVEYAIGSNNWNNFGKRYLYSCILFCKYHMILMI